MESLKTGIRRLARTSAVASALVTLALLTAGLHGPAAAGAAPGTHVTYRAAKVVAKRVCTKTVHDYQYASMDPSQQHMTASTNTPCVTAAPWVLIIHGGSWNSGSAASLAPVADDFYARGFQVFNMDYRVNAGITWGQQLNDANAAANWIRAKATTFHLDLDKGTVFGSSAGGHMAAMIGVHSDFSSVVTANGVLMPQRVAEDDNGLRPDTEPTTVNMHNLHNVEIGKMGCDYPGAGVDNGACTDRWEAFEPERAGISSASPKFLMAEGDLDPIVPLPTPDEFHKLLNAKGAHAMVIHVPGVGHSTAVFFDNGPQEAHLFQWIAAQYV